MESHFNFIATIYTEKEHSWMVSKVNPYLKIWGTKIIMAFVFDGFDELPTSQQQQNSFVADFIGTDS